MTQEQAATGQDGRLRVSRVTFPIDSISCDCNSSLLIERSILQVNGVRNAYVSPDTEMAYVEFDPSCCTLNALTEAIEHVGFHAGAPIVR